MDALDDEWSQAERDRGRSLSTHQARNGEGISLAVAELTASPKTSALAELTGLADLRKLIVFLVRAVVENPEQVSLRVSHVDAVSLIEIQVAPEDLGKVIGRDGRTIQCLRTVALAAARQHSLQVRLELLEENAPAKNGRRGHRSRQRQAVAAVPQE